MRPAGRTAGEPLALPQFALPRNAMDPCLDELRAGHPALRACVARQEPRAQFFPSMGGHFRARARQSIAPMALQGEGGTGRALQRLVREPLWDAAALREPSHRWARPRGASPRAC